MPARLVAIYKYMMIDAMSILLHVSISNPLQEKKTGATNLHSLPPLLFNPRVHRNQFNMQRRASCLNLQSYGLMQQSFLNAMCIGPFPAQNHPTQFAHSFVG
ncbi:hypothetical protein Pst134EA_025406 [Puccinia striiformis f. sp. tritici]|uniref:hypothetical protein n=1 Tax=Puccinia striiformis f. sp. tritici TaxID=168172 RepID=UPI0020074C48|nr:hypothetical protein Pst134EA_025406 [Puccinia striiformis f. sp. tritici]KAH9451452.1 hypothetical protein Pst134EA_025406 [Puccinia striiformis f. sp. tritici]